MLEMESQNVRDWKCVAAQLGREPRGTLDVVTRCPHGYPQVLRVHPMIEGKPFPTLYWLSCPFLVREVGRLEADGGCRRLAERMRTDPHLHAAMERAHDRYARDRAERITTKELGLMQKGGRSLGLSDRGIGGIRDRAHLKCLHLHVAHALADENPIGTIVLRQLTACSCPAKHVICSAYERRSRSDGSIVGGLAPIDPHGPPVGG
jgi:hypothetical protein